MSAPFDPRQVPTVSQHERLPPVLVHHLTPEALRARFASPPVWTPEVDGDTSADPHQARVSASVLVPLVSRAPDHLAPPSVLLTRRTAHLKSHAGQVSFPGGRREATDAHEVATALREAKEEVGLDPARVEVLGQLPPYLTVTGFLVTPIVGLIRAWGPGHDTLALKADPHEVDEMFEVPLDFLMNPTHHRRHEFELAERRVGFYAMPWQAPGRDDEHFIWGATAAMLRNLYRFLSA